MKARDTVILWNPVTGAVLCREREVSTPPGEREQFPFSGGACYRTWREANPAALLLALIRTAIDLVADYDIPAEAVFKEFDKIDEYRAFINHDPVVICNKALSGRFVLCGVSLGQRKRSKEEGDESTRL